MTRTLATLWISTLFLAPPASSEIPNIIQGREPDASAEWIAGAHLTRDGVTDWSLLNETQIRMIRRDLLVPERPREHQPRNTTPTTRQRWPRQADCPALFGVAVAQENWTLEQLLENVEEVHIGTIVDAEDGIVVGSVETMYEVEIDQTLLGPQRPGTTHLFSFPGGRIEVEDGLVCYGGYRNESGPSTGTRAILLLRNDDEDALSFHRASERELIWQRPDGSVSLPYWIQDRESSRLSSLSKTIRAIRTAISKKFSNGNLP